MKKALRSLSGPVLFVALITGTIPALNQMRYMSIDGDGGASPDTPGSPDMPLCAPDIPCPDIPNAH